MHLEMGFQTQDGATVTQIVEGSSIVDGLEALLGFITPNILCRPADDIVAIAIRRIE